MGIAPSLITRALFTTPITLAQINQLIVLRLKGLYNSTFCTVKRSI